MEFSKQYLIHGKVLSSPLLYDDKVMKMQVQDSDFISSLFPLFPFCFSLIPLSSIFSKAHCHVDLDTNTSSLQTTSA